MSARRNKIIFTVVFFLLSAIPCLAKEPLPLLEGIIEAKETIDIGSQTPGIVEKILVERGDYVKKGQLLVRLQSSVEQAEVALKKARVDFIARKVARSQELIREKMISLNETDELETELLLSRLELNEAESLLKLKSIISPINGIVTSRTSSAGEYIGSDIAILSLAQIDPLYVEVVAPVMCFGSIRKGMKAEIQPEAPLQGKTYLATVIIVDRVIDAASATFGVRLLLPNPGMKLPAGLKCHVKFITPEK
jgi:RND family efflux transporter MFP subunit